MTNNYIISGGGVFLHRYLVVSQQCLYSKMCFIQSSTFCSVKTKLFWTVAAEVFLVGVVIFYGLLLFRFISFSSPYRKTHTRIKLPVVDGER